MNLNSRDFSRFSAVLSNNFAAFILKHNILHFFPVIDNTVNDYLQMLFSVGKRRKNLVISFKSSSNNGSFHIYSDCEALERAIWIDFLSEYIHTHCSEKRTCLNIIQVLKGALLKAPLHARESCGSFRCQPQCKYFANLSPLAWVYNTRGLSALLAATRVEQRPIS